MTIVDRQPRRRATAVVVAIVITRLILLLAQPASAMRRESVLDLVVNTADGTAAPGAAAQTAPADPRLTAAIAWYTGTAGQVDDARAHELLIGAAAAGDPLSRMWVARCHSTGRMGFSRDQPRARAIASEVLPSVRSLALAGDREAIFLMGTAYDEGLGVDIDAVEAASSYRRAAELGHVLAQHNLGNLYEAGRGVPQDDALAVAWWRRAAEQGDAIPMFRLGTMYETGRGVAHDVRQARDWYERAAARGLARAREALARLGG
jgi:TPR repeat protein